MKEIARLVLTLTIISASAGLLLAWVNDITAQPIAAAQRAETLAAIKAVLPECDNAPDEDVVTCSGVTFYRARREGSFVGAAFETVSSEGYGGDIAVMVGVDGGGMISAVKILKHAETPGLGAKIRDRGFKAQFSGKSLAGTAWLVDKDGGDINGITAATISSRAVTGAIKHGLEIFASNKQQIGTRESSATEYGSSGSPSASEEIDEARDGVGVRP